MRKKHCIAACIAVEMEAIASKQLHNCRIWVTSNPRPFFFETQCPVNGWITETVNAQRYQTLLRDCRAMFNSTRSDCECRSCRMEQPVTLLTRLRHS
ncbi:hypothetical protein TNCV_2710561 [Trichonephila clavipes]|nr:hypothetical protein TNCV_2710561 [Trichonephila clavipes]